MRGDVCSFDPRACAILLSATRSVREVLVELVAAPAIHDTPGVDGIATIATGVSGVAANKRLFSEQVQCTGVLVNRRFHLFGGAERPATPTLSLVFDWGGCRDHRPSCVYE